MIGVIAFILTGVFVPMLILECLDWLPWVADRLIQRAASHLPLESQARYVEEWKADFIALPGGKLTKLLFGFRVWASSRTTGKVIREEAKIQAEKTQMDMLAVRVLVLAQQVADQAIADARREADETLARAKHDAEKMLLRANRLAELRVASAGKFMPDEGPLGTTADQLAPE